MAYNVLQLGEVADFERQMFDLAQMFIRNPKLDLSYGMTSSGKSGVIVTSEHESEKFLLMVKTEIGQVVTVECGLTLYYEKQVGQKIDCKAYKGFFTGSTWSMYGVR